MANDRQKTALTVFSLLLVVGAAAFFVWLSAAVATGAARGATWPGKALMLLIYDWNSLSGVFKGLLAIIAGGIACLPAHKMKDWLFHIIVASSVLGFLATAYLFFEVTTVSTAKNFWAYSPTDRLHDYQSFVPAARVGLGFFCSWFIGVLAGEFGIRRFG